MKYLVQTENITEEKAKDLDYGRVITDNTDKSSYLVNYGHTHYNAIDMGLESGTLWMDKNVGAEKDTDTGLYFQWGDTQGYTADEVGTKKNFSWSTYKYCKGTETSFTKYNCFVDNGYNGFTDGKVFLETIDDMALQNTHRFVVPTITQFTELINGCTYEWTTKDGVNGGLFTSKTNGNTLFFPVTQLADRNSLNSQQYGHYWANETIYQSYRNCNKFTVRDDSTYTYVLYKYYGLCVRGVCKKG